MRTPIKNAENVGRIEKKDASGSAPGDRRIPSVAGNEITIENKTNKSNTELPSQI